MPTNRYTDLEIMLVAVREPVLEGRRYGNSRVWDYIRDPEDILPIPHMHACPVCYDREACEMACYLEPDLELDDGTPSGSPCKCSRCEIIDECNKTTTNGKKHA